MQNWESCDAVVSEVRKVQLTTFGWELTQILSEPQLNLLLTNVAPLLESCKWDNTVSPRLYTPRIRSVVAFGIDSIITVVRT
jgi:hypothetical protein